MYLPLCVPTHKRSTDTSKRKRDWQNKTTKTTTTTTTTTTNTKHNLGGVILVQKYDNVPATSETACDDPSGRRRVLPLHPERRMQARAHSYTSEK
jgi:hypothetical protein